MGTLTVWVGTTVESSTFGSCPNVKKRVVPTVVPTDFREGREGRFKGNSLETMIQPPPKPVGTTVGTTHFLALGQLVFEVVPTRKK